MSDDIVRIPCDGSWSGVLEGGVGPNKTVEITPNAKEMTDIIVTTSKGSRFEFVVLPGSQPFRFTVGNERCVLQMQQRTPEKPHGLRPV